MTGIVSNTYAISRLLHEHGALSFFDFAAAAPYVSIEMDPPGDPLAYKDAVFISPHKFIGGPGTPGVLVARRELFRNRVPSVPGGGTVPYVNPFEHVYLSDIEHREEGGTPAIVESIRAGLVFGLKAAVGVDAIREREHDFIHRAMAALGGEPRRSRSWAATRRSGCRSCRSSSATTGRYLHHNFVVALLNDLFGIQSRGGCSCAGPYGHRLLGIDLETIHEFEREIARGCEGIKPGWVRVNFNYFISEAVFEFILDAVDLVASEGWRLLPDYAFEPGDRDVAPPGRPAGAAAEPGETSRTATGGWRTPSHRHREPESRLAGYLDEARGSSRAAATRWPARPGAPEATSAPTSRRCAGSSCRRMSSAMPDRTAGRPGAGPRHDRGQGGARRARRAAARAGPGAVPDGRGAGRARRAGPGGLVGGGRVGGACDRHRRAPRSSRSAAWGRGRRWRLVDADGGAGAPGDHLAGPARRGRRLRAAAEDGVAGAGGRGGGAPGDLAARPRGTRSALWLTGEAVHGPAGSRDGAGGGRAARRRACGRHRCRAGVRSGPCSGALRPVAAGALGLPAGIPVVVGVNDGTASMLGAGLRAAGDAVDTGGTSGGIAIYADHPIALPGVFVAPAPIPGRWVVGGAMAATGAAVDWLRGAVLGDRWTAEELFAEAASVPAGAEGLVFLPYLAGERAPIFDEEARGAFVGLTLAHARGHLARAVLEGAAFAVRHVAEPIIAAGVPLREVRLAGRSSPGDTWARIKADVLGVPVAIPSIGDTAVLGAAILAAAGIGAVPDLGAGVAAMTSVARRLEPDPGDRARYDELFAVYRGLYPALRPSFGALGR